MASFVRAKTPDNVNATQLLTPPPTAGLPKRVRFSGEHDDEREMKRIMLDLDGEGEQNFASSAGSSAYLDGGFGGPLEDMQIKTIYGAHTHDVKNPLRRPKRAFPTPPISPCSNEGDFDAAPPSLDRKSQSIQASKLFNFMGLPLKVREIIYGDLLTVPSLICLRQNQTVHSKEDGAYVFAEHRELLSGISFALTQTAVDGLKSRVHRHESFNIAILRVSRQVFTETRKVFYGCNEFQLFNRTPETSPPVDFSVPLFPPGYARFVKNITICAHHVYGLGYLLKGGHKDLKNRYRNLQRLTLVLELESSIKNYGKQFTRARSEDWPTYVARVQAILQQETYNCQGISKSVPSWVELKALFIGDRYIEGHKNSNINRPTLVASDELTRRAEIKSAITDAFNHFKRSY